MSQQRPQAGGRRGDARGSASSACPRPRGDDPPSNVLGGASSASRIRIALAAGLLALVAVGLRVSAPPPALDGPFRHDGLLIGVILEAVLACLLVALAVRNSRAPRGALLAARLRRLLTYVVGIGLAAIPVAYLVSRHAHLSRIPVPPRQTGSPAVPRHGHDAGYVAGWVIVIILALLAAAVVIYVLVRVLPLSRGFWAGLRWRAARAVAEPAPADDESDLLEAVQSGRSALRRLDDARSAIIACYVAMEESLARAGTARAAADTPDELLARAAARGLVTGAAPARLTALFYEARFSSHPMRPTARDAAEHALGELAVVLGDANVTRVRDM
jgi:hypothetical protein